MNNPLRDWWTAMKRHWSSPPPEQDVALAQPRALERWQEEIASQLEALKAERRLYQRKTE